MEHKAQTLYNSKNKALNNEPFLTVKKARNYFVYAERAGIDSVAFILAKDNKFGLINESKPPLDERMNKRVQMTTAFGGSIDTEKDGVALTPEEICQLEVLEESGFEVTLDRIHPVDKTLVSSQMNQFCYGFFVDVNNLEADTEDNKTEWFNHQELMLNNDWKSIWILAGYVFKSTNKGKRSNDE